MSTKISCEISDDKISIEVDGLPPKVIAVASDMGAIMREIVDPHLTERERDFLDAAIKAFGVESVTVTETRTQQGVAGDA